MIEIVAGAFLLVCAVALWRGRRSLARKELPMRNSGSGSALIAGASIAVVELPTAVPYFAVIATIVASSASVPGEVGLLVAYNVAFVLPLLGIVAVLLRGRRSRRPAARTVRGVDPTAVADGARGSAAAGRRGLIIVGGAGLVKG